MKNILLIGFLTAYLLPSVKAQDCSSVYIPLKNGAQLEYTQYNSSDKVQGSYVQKITNLTSSASAVQATVQIEHFDTNKQSTGSGEVVLRCDNGIFYLDMQSYLQGMDSYEDMELTIQGGKLALPASMKAGDMLENGDMILTVSTGGVKIMAITVTISNRKVETVESLTTPAGTFECYKITYDVATKMMGTQQAKGVEWYSRNVGLIRQETYDAKGKVAGYTLLTSVK